MTYQLNSGLSLNQAIRINGPVMRSKAVARIFETELMRPMHKFTTLEDRHFGAITALEYAIVDGAQVRTEKLNVGVQMVNGCGKSTAANTIIEMLDLGVFETVNSATDGRTTFFVFAQGIREKINELCEVELKINEVIKAQIANPFSVTAGSEYISEDHYFHCMSDIAKKLAKEALEAKLKCSRKTEMEGEK